LSAKARYVSGGRRNARLSWSEDGKQTAVRNRYGPIRALLDRGSSYTRWFRAKLASVTAKGAENGGNGNSSKAVNVIRGYGMLPCLGHSTLVRPISPPGVRLSGQCDLSTLPECKAHAALRFYNGRGLWRSWSLACGKGAELESL
jgi:hypothetical protein